MHGEIRTTGKQWGELRGHLLSDDAEHAAVLLCGYVDSPAGPILTAREVVPLSNLDLEPTSGQLHLEISPRALARIAKRARLQKLTLVLAHSHPFPGPVYASAIDLSTEQELCGRVLSGRTDGKPVGALILGPDGEDARIWRQGQPITAHVSVVNGGPETPSRGPIASDEAIRAAQEVSAYQRQILLWGSRGQERLAESHVVVVGAGGTGSHVTQQLAHLGVGHLTLIDDDRVEVTNLSRLVGANPAQVGEAKVKVLAAHVHQINPTVHVVAREESVLDIDPTVFADADVLVCCTDSHGSRSLLNEVAYQFLVPLIDMGIEVIPGASGSRAGGGVRLIRPDGPCLHCMSVLDTGLVREDFLSPAERAMEAQRGYLRGAAVEAPSVISLNGVVASLAAVEILNELLGLFPVQYARVLYRAEARSLRTATVDSRADCYVCGEYGVTGLGSSRPFPRRRKDLDLAAG